MTLDQLDYQSKMIEQFQNKYGNRVEVVVELKNGKEYIFSNDNFNGVYWNDETKEFSFYYCPDPLKNFGYLVSIGYNKIRTMNPVFRSFDVPMLNPTQRFEKNHVMKIKSMEEVMDESDYAEDENEVFEEQNNIQDYHNPSFT